MATNRKRIPRSRKETGLTPAEHYFLYGEKDPRELTPEEASKLYNPFEMLMLIYPNTPKAKARVEELKSLRPEKV